MQKFDAQSVAKLKMMTLLYVEDEIELLDSISSILKEFFKDVLIAKDGLEALEIFERRTEGIDVIVTDISMPKLDGIELIKQVREISSSIPIIITTAFSDSDYIFNAINLNVNGYVLKPINVSVLLENILKAVEPYLLRIELERLNKELFEKYREKNQELETIINNMDNMVVVGNKDGIHTASKNFLEFVDAKDLDDLNEKITTICDIFDKESFYFDVDQYTDCYEELINKIDKSDLLIQIKNKIGIEDIFKVGINSYEYKGKHYIVSLTNITKLKEESNHLLYLATHDALTKIYNRNKLLEDLNEEMVRVNRYNKSLSIIMFDIDFFKKINDTYGHDIGDEVLINLSKTIKNSIREIDTFARWGGEEFMILLPETDIDSACNLAEKLKNIIQNSNLLDKKDINLEVTCSFGVTSYIKNETSEEFLKRVDEALYEAKNSGRNRVIKN